MKIRATIAAHYRLRVGAIAALVCLFCAWFLLDGYLNWPKEVEIWSTYEQLQAEPDGMSQWQQLVKDKGWPEKPHRRTNGDVMVQKILGFALAPFGLLFAFAFLRTFGRWIELERDGIVTSSGHELAFAKMTKLDKTRWRKKGIAVVHGDEGTLVLDDWKYDRNATRVLLETVEEFLSPKQIIGDVPESEKDKASKGDGVNAEASEGDSEPEDADSDQV